MWWRKHHDLGLERPSESPELNPVEMLWTDLKKAIHMRCPNNKTELKQFCQEEWAKIPPRRCAGLIYSYRKLLVDVITASSKGSLTLSSAILNVELVCLIKTWKIKMLLCYYFRHIIFVNTLDLDEHHITFYDRFIQKTMKLQKVYILFLDTVSTLVSMLTS